jgi:O-antigen/teichoic acid export membrane protein
MEGLGLVQMTVLARIIDNHQFGLLTVSLVIIALADTRWSPSLTTWRR